MTATDLAVRDPQAAAAISAKIQYARALAESGLLPASYRKNLPPTSCGPWNTARCSASRQ